MLRAVVSVESAVYLSSETILNIGIEGALSGTNNTQEISAELLFKAVNAVTLAYLIAGDCIALGAVSTTIEDSKAYVESMAIPLEEVDKKKYKGYCVYLLCDSLNDYKVSYVGMTNNPWRRKKEHENDPSKKTLGKPWDMYVVMDKLSKREARTLENALICVYTISALANARHEIAVKNFDGFEKEFARAASICKIPTGDLYNAMRGDYK